MGWSTKNGNVGPEIIYTQQFQRANGTRYLKYTERDEAIKNNLVKAEIDTTKNIQNDPDIPKDFDGYLGYTDRKAATKLEKGVIEGYPTFTDEALNINEYQHKNLEKKLRQAQKNKSLMWIGVLSFSPEFLERVGIYDPKTKEVDQRKIKESIQKAMPIFLGKEGLDVPETFWWGDIHLNTNHVHVHLTISQTKNTRPFKGKNMPVGMFKQKSIRAFKSSVHNKLELEKVRQREIDLEKELGVIKKDLTTNVKNIVEEDQSRVNYLQQIYLSLPDYEDKRKWRANNHRKDFVLPRTLVKDFIDRLLEKDLKSSYDQFLHDISDQYKRNKVKYGPNILDTKTKKEKELKEYLMNRVFDYFREHIDELPKTNSISKKVELSDPKVNELILELEKEILLKLDPDSFEAKRLRKEIGLRRYFIRQKNLTDKLLILKSNLERIEKREDLPVKVKEVAKEKLQKQIRLVQLSKLSKKQREKQDLQKEYEKLKEQCTSAKNISINDLTTRSVRHRKRQIANELKLVKKYNVEIGDLLDDDFPLNTISVYEKEVRILELKLQIKNNNQRYKDDIEKRNKINRSLFKELTQVINGIDSEQIKSGRSYVNKRQQGKVKENKRSFNDQAVIKSFRQLLNSLKYEGQGRMNAVRKHSKENDDLERQERKEEQEIERDR